MSDKIPGATPRHPDLAESGDALIQDAWDRESLYDLSVIAKEALRLLRAARLSEIAPKSAGMCMYCGNVFHAKDTSEPEVARVYAEALAHDQVCPHNPLVKKLADLSASRCVVGQKELVRSAREREHEMRCGNGNQFDADMIGLLASELEKRI